LLGSSIQEFRSSGVQEFRSSGVQEFRSSGVQEFRSSAWGTGRIASKKAWESKYEMQAAGLGSARFAFRCPELLELLLSLTTDH
jgi:hypothetical protein